LKFRVENATKHAIEAMGKSEATTCKIRHHNKQQQRHLVKYTCAVGKESYLMTDPHVIRQTIHNFYTVKKFQYPKHIINLE
jgi:hypothetical protein